MANLDRIDIAGRALVIGGSDARVIMGSDLKALVRLWREKRGEVEPEDLNRELVVQMGHWLEPHNIEWFEQMTGTHVVRRQDRIVSEAIPFLAATLDGVVYETDAVFEAKFMLPWKFSPEEALAKHQAQLQHNMMVGGFSRAALSIITGGGQWLEIEVPADPMYQAVLLEAEQRFWACVQSGQEPRLWGDTGSPLPAVKPAKIVNMAGSNAWAEHATVYLRTQRAANEHGEAKDSLKALMPPDAKEAFGHGVRAKRSKANAVSFETYQPEETYHVAAE